MPLGGQEGVFMAIRTGLDSDVDQITAFAIQGVNAFIALYEDERNGEPPRVAAGTLTRPSARRAPSRAAKSPPRRRTKR